MLGHPLMNLSVEQVIDCDDSEDPPKMYADCGVYGGWPYLAFGYLERQVRMLNCSYESYDQLAMEGRNRI